MRIYKTREQFTKIQNGELSPPLYGSICTITDESDHPSYLYNGTTWDSFVTSQVNSSTGGITYSPGGNVAGFAHRYGGTNTAQVIEKFAKLSQWTKTAGDTVNADVSAAPDLASIGSSSLRFVSTATASKSAYVDQDQKINLNTRGGFWVCWNQRYMQTAASVGLTAYMSHSAAMAAGVGRVSKTGIQNTVGFGKQSDWVSNVGWTTLDGTPNFANDWLSWRFRIDSNASEPHDWDLDGIVVGGYKPRIVISFDDGWDSSYSVGFVEAQKREMPLTHYLIGSLLNQSNYITAAQAAEMKAAGDYIGVHGVGGANTWDVNTAAQIASDRGALGSLTDGLHGSWPEGKMGFGTAPAANIAAAKSVGLKTVRQIASAQGVFLPGYTEWGAMPGYPLNNTVNLATAQAAVDRVIASKGALIFYGHKLGGAADSLTWVTSDYQALLDYIAQKRLEGAVDVVTVAQLYDEIYGRQEV